MRGKERQDQCGPPFDSSRIRIYLICLVILVIVIFVQFAAFYSDFAAGFGDIYIQTRWQCKIVRIKHPMNISNETPSNAYFFLLETNLLMTGT